MKPTFCDNCSGFVSREIINSSEEALSLAHTLTLSLCLFICLSLCLSLSLSLSLSLFVSGDLECGAESEGGRQPTPLTPKHDLNQAAC